ncbi:MAG: GAF domain-containing sensor histidine kinase [Bacteroidia bacterium]
MDGQLHIIRAFTQSLSANTSLEKVCRELVSKTIDYLGETTIAVYLFSDKSQELVRIACRNNRDGGNAQPHPTLSEQSDEQLVWQTYKKCKPALHNPPPKHLQKILERKNRVSEMAVPIVYADKPLGVVYLTRPSKNKFTQDTLLFISVMTSIAATVMVKTLASSKLSHTKEQLIKNRDQKILHKKKLEEVKGRMDEILYSLSHEFRGPVLTTMSLLDRLAMDPKRFQEYHPMLKTTVNRLDSILLNIFYYSNNLREPVYSNAVIPERVIKEIVDFLKHEFKTEFQVRIRSNSDGYIITDENRFKVIIRTLLINALQYGYIGSQKPEIDINLHFSTQSCKISIQDHGPGMPKSMLKNTERIFNRGSALSKGAGLGIFVCKELARKIGASIEWISQTGVGTRVVMEVSNSDK